MGNPTEIPILLMEASFRLVRMPDRTIKVEVKAEGTAMVADLHCLIGAMEDCKQRLLSRADKAQESVIPAPRGPFLPGGRLGG